MGWQGTLRAIRATERRQQREAQKRQRELERRAKDQAKLSAIEQARLAVETYENQLEVLLSVHKQQGETWDWIALAASLSPLPPQRNSHHEFRARQQLEVSTRQEDQSAVIERARLLDEQEFQDAHVRYTQDKTEWEKMTGLARRILAGEHKAYIEALVDLNSFEEISHLGSSLHFTIHTPKLVECQLKVNGRQAIPSEIKSLTATGKVSVKAMPKARFHEIYQDYVCACVLRVAREVLALLPADTLLVTASADELDSRTGQIVEQPVLSAAIPQVDVARLDFERLDPSDAMENFVHRGDFKASRRTGAFETIVPLTPADLPSSSPERMDSHDLLADLRRCREELRIETEKLKPKVSVTELVTN
jgi:hypothetical protein